MSDLNKLRRSKEDSVIAGVCGGIGKYTNIPSWLIRILFICTVLYFGMGIIPYVLFWLLMPEETD